MCHHLPGLPALGRRRRCRGAGGGTRRLCQPPPPTAPRSRASPGAAGRSLGYLGSPLSPPAPPRAAPGAAQPAASRSGGAAAEQRTWERGAGGGRRGTETQNQPPPALPPPLQEATPIPPLPPPRHSAVPQRHRHGSARPRRRLHTGSARPGASASCPRRPAPGMHSAAAARAAPSPPGCGHTPSGGGGRELRAALRLEAPPAAFPGLGSPARPGLAGAAGTAPLAGSPWPPRGLESLALRSRWAERRLRRPEALGSPRFQGQPLHAALILIANGEPWHPPGGWICTPFLKQQLLAARKFVWN